MLLSLPPPQMARKQMILIQTFTRGLSSYHLVTVTPVEEHPLWLHTSHSFTLTLRCLDLMGAYMMGSWDGQGTFVQGCVLGQAPWERIPGIFQGSSQWILEKYYNWCSRQQEFPIPDALSLGHPLSCVLILDSVVLHFVKIYSTHLCILILLGYRSHNLKFTFDNMVIQELYIFTKFCDYPNYLTHAFWLCALFVILGQHDYLWRVIW